MKFKVEGKCKEGCYVDVAIVKPIAYAVVFGIFGAFIMLIIAAVSIGIASPENLPKPLPDFIFVMCGIVGFIGVVFGLLSWRFWEEHKYDEENIKEYIKEEDLEEDLTWKDFIGSIMHKHHLSLDKAIKKVKKEGLWDKYKKKEKENWEKIKVMEGYRWDD